MFIVTESQHEGDCLVFCEAQVPATNSSIQILRFNENSFPTDGFRLVAASPPPQTCLELSRIGGALAEPHAHP